MSNSPQQYGFTEAQSREVRKRLRRVWALSPEERMARFFTLQTTAWASLQTNPAALTAFHRRNRDKRRHSNARQVLADMQKTNNESA